MSECDCGKQMTIGSFMTKLGNEIEYEKFILENGLTVYLMEQHEVPLIHVSAVFPAGAVKDNGQYGLASLTAEGLLLGTRSYTKKEIEEGLKKRQPGFICLFSKPTMKRFFLF